MSEGALKMMQSCHETYPDPNQPVSPGRPLDFHPYPPTRYPPPPCPPPWEFYRYPQWEENAWTEPPFYYHPPWQYPPIRRRGIEHPAAFSKPRQGFPEDEEIITSEHRENSPPSKFSATPMPEYHTAIASETRVPAIDLSRNRISAPPEENELRMPLIRRTDDQDSWMRVEMNTQQPAEPIHHQMQQSLRQQETNPSDSHIFSQSVGPQSQQYPLQAADNWGDRPVGKGAGPQPSEYPDQSQPAKPRSNDWDERPVGKGAGPQPAEYPDQSQPAKPRSNDWNERPVGKGPGPQPAEYPDQSQPPKPRSNDWDERPVGKGTVPQPSEYPDQSQPAKPCSNEWDERPVGKGAGPQPPEYPDQSQPAKPRSNGWNERPVGKGAEPQPSGYPDQTRSAEPHSNEWDDRPIGKGAGPQHSEYPDQTRSAKPRSSDRDDSPIGKEAEPQPSGYPDQSRPTKPHSNDWDERPVGKGDGPQPSENPDQSHPAKPRSTGGDARPVGKRAEPQLSEYSDNLQPTKPRSIDWDERPVGKGVGPQPSEYPDQSQPTKPRSTGGDARPVGKRAEPQLSEYSDNLQPTKPRSTNWDERPVGKGARPQPSEYPDQSQPTKPRSNGWDERPVGKGAGPQPSEFPDMLQPTKARRQIKSNGDQPPQNSDQQKHSADAEFKTPTHDDTDKDSGGDLMLRGSLLRASVRYPLGRRSIIAASENDERPLSPHKTDFELNAEGKGGEGLKNFEALVDQEWSKHQQIAAEISEEEMAMAAVPLIDRLRASRWEVNIHGLKEFNTKAVTWVAEDDPNKPEDMQAYKEAILQLVQHKTVAVQKESLDALSWVFRLQEPAQVKEDWAPLEDLILTGRVSNPKLQAAAAELTAVAIEVCSEPFPITRIVELMKQYRDAKDNVVLKGPAAKIAAYLWTLVTKLIELFGFIPLKLQSVMELVKPYIAVTDRNTKEAVYKFCIEVFKWTSNMDIASGSMEEKQLKELQKRCDSLKDNSKPTPQRIFANKKQVRKKENANSPVVNDNENEAGTDDGDRIDPFELMPGVDIFENVNLDKWEKSLRDAGKWSEKKKLLSDLVAPLEKAKKLKATRTTAFQVKHFFTVLMNVIQFEKNSSVTVQAVKCAGDIALCWRDGLPSDLAKQMIHCIVPKTKDKNKSIQQSIVETMNHLLYSLTIDGFLDDIQLACKEKNPQLRQTLVAWISSSFIHPAMKESDIVKCASRLAAIATDTIDDTQASVRAASALLLLTLQNITPKIVNSAVEELPARKRQTAKEAMKKVQKETPEEIEKCSPVKAAKAALVKPNEQAPSVARPKTEITEPASMTTKTNARRVSLTSTIPRTQISDSAVPSPKSPDFTEEDVSNLPELTATIEECESGLAQILGQEVEESELIQNCRSNSWTNRSAGLDLLKMELVESSDHQQRLLNRTDLITIMLYLKSLTKDLRENNTMVIRKAIEVIAAILQRLAELHDEHHIVSKPDTRQSLKGLQPSPLAGGLALSIMRPTFERLSDARLAKFVPPIFLLIGEILSPLFVLYTVSDCIKKNVNVKAQSEGIQLLNQIVCEFPPLLLPTNLVLEVFKDLLSDGRSQSKKSIHLFAISIMATRHIPNGKSLVAVLQSISPKKSVKPVLMKELEPLQYTPSGFPQLEKQVSGRFPRFLRGVRDEAKSAPMDKSQLMAAVPDVSIESKLNSDFMKEFREKIKDNNWKKRRDILQELIQIFCLGSRFEPSPVIIELAQMLRTKLQAESNRVVVKCVVDAIGQFATCLENTEPARQAGRILLPALVVKFAERTAQLQVCNATLDALSEWLRTLGLITFVNSAIFPAGGSPPVRLGPSKKEEFHTMIDSVFDSPETYFSQNPNIINPEGLPLLPFVRLLCGDSTSEKSPQLKAVANALALKCLPGLSTPELASLVSDIQTLPPPLAAQMNALLEAARCRLDVQPETYPSANVHSDESRRLEDTVSSSSTVRAMNVRVISPSREKPVTKSNFSPQSQLAIYANPPDTSLPEREAAFLTNGGHWPVNLTIDDLERLAEEWRAHISPALAETMFPELAYPKPACPARLATAMAWWASILDFDTMEVPQGVEARPPCDSLETRLAVHPTYARLFGLQEGIMDLLFKWLCLRLGDSNPRISKAAAEVLYRAVSRLNLALGDASYLMSAIQMQADEENRQLTMEENTALMILDQEGKITLTQTNLLLPHLLDKYVKLDANPTATLVKDLLLNLSMLTPDPAALYHTTLRIYPRRPEILDLTNFLIEQHGWRLCRDIGQELQDFARLSMSNEANQDVRFLAAHCMCLIMLSLPRKLAAEALKELDHEIPGSKRYVAKFVKANPQLIHAFPPEGLAPLEPSDAYTLHDGQSVVLQKGDGDKLPDGESVEEMPFRDFMVELDEIFDGSEIEKMIKFSKDNILDMRFNMRIANCRLLMQDFMIEMRKEKEGRNISVEYEMRYWNAMRRIEFVQQAPSLNHTTILLETSRLATGDPSLIKEAAIRLKSLLAATASTTPVAKKTSDKKDLVPAPSEWPVVFSSELVSACAKALFTIFRHESLSQIPSENTAFFDDAAQAVTQLTLQITKIRKVLYPVAPSQLKQLYRGVLTAMSCHTLWAASPVSNVIVERLNNIMGVHLMGIVSPRTASSLVEVTFEFLINTSTDETNEASQPRALIDLELFLRVFKRLLRKLNTKHPMGTDHGNSDTSQGVWPVYSHDRLNYLRLLDVALVCLLFVEIKIPVPSFESPLLRRATTFLDGQFDDKDAGYQADDSADVNSPQYIANTGFLLSLRETLETCLRELFQILFIYCPHLCAVYFRDKGFKSSTALQNKIDTMRENNTLIDEYEFPPSSVEILRDATYMPLILQPDLTRIEFVSFCLERLMRRPPGSEAADSPDATRESTTEAEGPPLRGQHSSQSYFDLHKEYVSSNATKLVVPDALPEFSIDSFIAAAPANVTLKALDATCASGWTKRRDALYLGETPTGKQDVVPAPELFKSWNSKFERIKQALKTDLPDVTRAVQNVTRDVSDDNLISGDMLTRLAMRLRDVKESLTPAPAISVPNS
eukprot:Gregarina_sp_Poly_1__10072@NODE_67_length_16383_cov_69_023903_g57_i0_p1_GENE_NODE_67_length_16383_cov_69_023903_g57_i0NODE_67_length_16383_cov_69_023903_g57_i0_p1_ORF_typecomplete_len3230_score529_41CLASP_N/PF12348_8/5_4e02CLASP_N/PF12348_8/1_9e12CLASP_N/PF12348_8/1_1CLASP_N/PF12348_8/3e03CLASP_N/PF12348_8/0_044CLASP_N/PF12348_8/1_8e02DUF4042/PF13251_6/0_26DUF4042/PF13251_6/1_6e04UNC45central/PF11701_8/4_5e03UNC45central/PF11701_8/2_6UNC45central/PF11701_8/1_6e02TAN/PF11640_8/1_3e02TAN/PF11640_8